MNKSFFLIFLLLIWTGGTFIDAQDERDGYQTKRDFTNFYFSPLKVHRDHPLHASIFQIPLLSARGLADDTGVMGVSFEYANIESDYRDASFVYDYEGGIYRLNFDLDFSIRDQLDLMIHYEVPSVDGDTFITSNGSNYLRSDMHKSASGNINVLARQKIYTFEDYGIDFGLVIGASIPVVSTKTLVASRNFDFGGGLLFTMQRDDYAIHFNAGFIYMKDSTAFMKSVEFNYSGYLGVSTVVRIIDRLYGLVQVTGQNPALKDSDSPQNFVFDGVAGLRYIYDAYVVEAWIGHGWGDASHGVNGGIGLSLCF